MIPYTLIFNIGVVMSNEIIVIDNSLVTSAYHLTLNEQRLILCALKKIEPMIEIAENQAFYISRDDFIELGVNPNIVAQEIRQATRDLMKKSVTVKTPLGTLEMPWLFEVLRFDKNAEQKLRERYKHSDDYDDYIRALRLHNLIDGFTHRADENIVARVVFHPKILPLLSNLKKNFTQFSIQDVAEFKSTYTHRIYQLMMQWKSTGCVKISIDDLRFMLMLGLKYPLFADFKKRVIDVAIGEINEKSPYNVKCEFIKKGRKFVAVEFTFKLKEKAKKTKEKTERDPATVDMFSGFTDIERQTIQQRIDEHIERLETKGETVGEYWRENITKKAIADRWGLDEYYEQLQTAENERLARKEQAERERQAKLAEQAEKQRREAENRAFIEHFESLAQDEQEQILNQVGDRMDGVFSDFYKKARESGTAHKDLMYREAFKQIMGV